MKQNAMARFPSVLSVWAYISQGAWVSPERSTAPTPTKINATIPLAVQEHHSPSEHVHENDHENYAESDEYYHYMKEQIKVTANHSGPPDPLGETRVGCRTPLCIGQVDTLVLVDVSGSVSEDDFKKMQDMLQKFPHHFDRSQFLALMSYGQYPEIMAQWTDSAENFKSAAMKMKLGWSAGDLGAGLARATEVLRYARDHSYHNVLVITDGATPSKLKAKQMAERLGESGAQLYMVVVEDYVGPAHDEAFEIIQSTSQFADPNQFMMSVDSYKDLDVEDTIGKMVYMLCPQVANLLSIGSKVERTVVDGNRTAATRRNKSQQKFRKVQARVGKH